MAKNQLTVAKITETELAELNNWLREIGDKVKDTDYIDDDDDETNIEIGKLVREKFPFRASFIAPLNLSILLDNYQDSESEILQHPKWIIKMNDLLEEMDKYLSENPKNYIGNGSILHEKIKELIAE